MPDCDDQNQRLAWHLNVQIYNIHVILPEEQQHTRTVKQRSILVSDALQMSALKTQDLSHLLVSHVHTMCTFGQPCES